MAYISKYKGSEIDALLSDAKNTKTSFNSYKVSTDNTIESIQSGITEVNNKIAKTERDISNLGTRIEEVAQNADNISKEELDNKQDKLVSGTNIKTINGQSLLGSGNITIRGGGSSGVEFSDADCRSAFISEMTAISNRLGAKSSIWKDPTGIENKSTAEDMCKILLHASGYEKLYDIWNTPSYSARKIKPNGSVELSTITSSVVSNDASKQLTNYYNVMGGKTGTMNRYSTNNLGVIMQSAKDNNRMYAVVVMQAHTNNSGSGNRFVATKEVMDILESKTISNGATSTTPSVLDDIAYENLTWRQIFINNNYAPNLNKGLFTSNKADTYTVSAGTCTIVTDETKADNYVPPYSLDVSGTTSCQLKSSKVDIGKLYLMACNVNVSSYNAGYCGVIIGSGSKSATVNRTTNGWEAITQRVTPETSSTATLYIGSATSANLNGRVNNPVIIPASIFSNVPDEETWQRLFEEYNQKLIEDIETKDDTQNEGDEEITLEPQADYACAFVVPKFPRAWQYLPLTPLYQKNASTEWYPASMSKILTALVVLNYVPDLNEKVKVIQEDVDALIAYGTGWYANDIVVDDTITYLDLLYYMFLPSSNIATQIVCRAVGNKILNSKNLG